MAAAARLTRIWDGQGAICQLTDAHPGVIFHSETGRPVREATKAWQTAVERLTDKNQADLAARRPLKRLTGAIRELRA